VASELRREKKGPAKAVYGVSEDVVAVFVCAQHEGKKTGVRTFVKKAAPGRVGVDLLQGPISPPGGRARSSGGEGPRSARKESAHLRELRKARMAVT